KTLGTYKTQRARRRSTEKNSHSPIGGLISILFILYIHVLIFSLPLRRRFTTRAGRAVRSRVLWAGIEHGCAGCTGCIKPTGVPLTNATCPTAHAMRRRERLRR